MGSVTEVLSVDEMYYRLEVSGTHAGDLYRIVHIATERDCQQVQEGRWALLAYLFADMKCRMLQRAPDIDQRHLLYEITPALWCGLDGTFIWLEPADAVALGFGHGI